MLRNRLQSPDHHPNQLHHQDQLNHQTNSTIQTDSTTQSNSTGPPRPTLPPKLTSPKPTPPPRSTQPRQPSIRFRPDIPRQPELMRRLDCIPTPQLRSSAPQPRPPERPQHRSPEPTDLKSCQLQPKKGREPTVERPSVVDERKLKRMKKKLDELNRKVIHARKKHNGLIHKRNSLRKAIEELKCGTKPEPLPESEWTFTERESFLEGL